MRKILSVGLIVVTTAAAPSVALADAQAAGSVAGIARGRHLQGLPSVKVQIRSTGGGEVVATATTNDAGVFAIPGLTPGDYLAEVVDAAGKVQGISAPFAVPAGGTASTSVIALGVDSAGATSGGGGFSLFGMGPVASMTVIGAAAAASVTAVVSTRPDASPSR